MDNDFYGIQSVLSTLGKHSCIHHNTYHKRLIQHYPHWRQNNSRSLKQLPYTHNARRIRLRDMGNNIRSVGFLPCLPSTSKPKEQLLPKTDQRPICLNQRFQCCLALLLAKRNTADFGSDYICFPSIVDCYLSAPRHRKI